MVVLSICTINIKEEEGNKNKKANKDEARARFILNIDIDFVNYSY
jgi:hypothetical protein